MPAIFNRKYAAAGLILAIMAAGFWLRAYNHHDWLYFKMDQARDSAMVANAVKNGPGELPLLGPRAGATEVSSGFLRLGPAFYYFQYLSGKIFNSVQPETNAYPDLFFGVFTIPLLYLFLRFYFGRRNSILITLMYAFSFIVIQYARFAWNPNSLLFFTLLSFYGLLKFLRSDNFWKKAGWAAVAAAGTAIGSQLHFLGLFCLPAILFFVLFFHWAPWKKWKKIDNSANILINDSSNSYTKKKIAAYFFAFILSFLIISSPIIISDVIRGGENTKDFIEAFSTKPNKKPLSTKISRSLDKQTKYYCLVMTSECYKGKTKDNIFFGLLTAAIMLIGLGLTARNLRREQAAIKKDFLWLSIAWFGIFFLLAIPVYSSLRPRFFIPVFPIPFIFLGLIFVLAEEHFRERGKYLAYLITAIIIALNLHGISAWFNEQKQSQIGSYPIDRTLVLKNQDGVTLAQLEKTVNYMYDNCEPRQPLIYYIKQEHFSPVKYLLSLKNNPQLVATRVEKENNIAFPYFAVIPTEKDGEKYIAEEFYGAKILETYPAGQITIYKIQNDPSRIKDMPQTNNQPEAAAITQSDRVFWRDIFGGGKKDKITVDDSSSDDLAGENTDD